MKWSERGDEYVLTVEHTDPNFADYMGRPYLYVHDVVSVTPAKDDNGRRIGWYVFESLPATGQGTAPFDATVWGYKWRLLTPEPIPRLDEAKAVAIAWWRMK